MTEKEKAKQETEYVVLALVPKDDIVDSDPADQPTYVILGYMKGKTDKAAISAIANGDGTYVAVPTRSFNPRTVTTETVPKVTIA